jgi:hypothetical protein
MSKEEGGYEGWGGEGVDGLDWGVGLKVGGWVMDE